MILLALSPASFEPPADEHPAVPELNVPAVEPEDPAARIAALYGKLPLAFVPNHGQMDSSVLFESRSKSGRLYFTDDALVISLPPAGRPLATDDFQAAWPADVQQALSIGQLATPAVLRLRFEGDNAASSPEAADDIPGVVNYLMGDDPSEWRVGLPAYGALLYRDLYPGIDLRYEGVHGRLKGTYTVAPGADPLAIRWRFEGAASARIDPETGALRLGLPGGGELMEDAPVAWQDTAAGRRPVAASFRLTDGLVSFALGAYDPALPLILDPVLVTGLGYSTYLGGSSAEDSGRIAVDSSGNIYIGGTTRSDNFPTTPGALYPSQPGGYDIFVAKLNAAGSALVYSTYLGGSGEDHSGAIAVDSSGNAYVSGWTYSTNFPTASPLQASNAGSFDVFLTKLNAAGSALVYSTYLGGTGNDYGNTIAVDSSGNAYVSGTTYSTNFPTASPFQASKAGSSDVFLTKLNAAGSALVYSTYLGGSSYDSGTGLAVDSSGNAYIAGESESTDFPTASPIQASNAGNSDVFLTKLNAAGSALLYSTYLGGSGVDIGYGIAVDSSGNAYVTGLTKSTNFPVLNALWPTFGGIEDAFVAKLNAAGSALVYSTYLGGTDGDKGYDTSADGSGNAYVTGLTKSTNFPVLNALQPSMGGFIDAFVVKLNPIGSALVSSTYLGGSGQDEGKSIIVDGTGNAYVSGYTRSTNFPTANPIQPSNGGQSDRFITKMLFNTLDGTLALPLGWSSSLTVTAVFTGTASGSPVAAGSLSNDGVTWGSWISAANGVPVTATWTLPGEGANQPVRLRLLDSNWLTSTAVTTATVNVDTTAPASSMTPLPAYFNGTGVTLNWSGSDAMSGVTGYDVEYRIGTSGGWNNYLSNTPNTSQNAILLGPDGEIYQFRVRARDGAGNVEAWPPDFDVQTIRDIAAPTGSVAINGGAVYVASVDTLLTLSASDNTSGVALMAFSADGAAFTPPEVYTTTRAWTLAGTDGTQTVWARYTDIAGNSTVVSDTIILDRLAPTAAIGSLAAYQAVPTFSVNWTGDDATSGVATYDVQVRAGAGSFTDWLTMTTSTEGVYTGTDGQSYAFRVRARDQAGNTPAYSSAVTTTVDLTPPVATSLAINGGAGSSTALEVTLIHSANDNVSGVAGMRFSNDGTVWSAWQPFAATAGWILSEGDGEKTVWLRVRDGAGHESAPISAQIGLDTAAGTDYRLSIGNGALYAAERDVILTIGAPAGTILMQVSNDGGFDGAIWEPFVTRKAWQLIPYGESIIHYPVYVRFRDANGAINGHSSDNIILDVYAPVGTVAIASGTLGAGRPLAATVTLQLTATDDRSGVASMQVANAADFEGTSWEPFATSKSWLLGVSGKVYARFQDNAGNLSAIASVEAPAPPPPPPTQPLSQQVVYIPTAALRLN